MKKLFPILVFTWFHGFGQDSIFFQNAEWSPDGKKICAETIRKFGLVLGYEGDIIDIKEKTIEGNRERRTKSRETIEEEQS